MNTSSPIPKKYRDMKAAALKAAEKEYFERLRIDCAGNVSEMARQAGMERSALRTKCRSVGVQIRA